MIDTVAKVGIVWCPKCFKLVPEFSDVPMYQCSGCGILLRVKNQNIRDDSAISGSSETNPSLSLSDNGSSNKGSTTSEKTNIFSLKLEGEHNASIQNHFPTKHFNVLTEEAEEAKFQNHNSRQDCENFRWNEKLKASLPPFSVVDKYRNMPRRTFSEQLDSSGTTDSHRHTASVGSESFYSVQSSIVSENIDSRPSLNPSKSSSFHKDTSNIQPERQSELLKLMEGLKGHLSELYEFQERKQIHKIGGSHYLNSVLSSNCQHKSRSKRYFLPANGGAPFVTCYKCFKLLHIPADFIISTRRLNKLRCGACSEILQLPFPARDRTFSKASSSTLSSDTSDSLEGPGPNVSRASSFEKRDDEIVPSASSLVQLMGYPSARDLMY